MFEVTNTTNAPAAIGPYSQAVTVNGVLYASGQIPLDPALASLCDGGKIEDMDADYLDVAATVIEHRLGLSE